MRIPRLKPRTLAAVGIGALALAAGFGVALYERLGATSMPTQPSGGTAMRAHKSPVQVPDAVFEDESGARRSLADFRGRYVLVNVWATWCAPCREEMPSLDRLQARLGGPEFEVLALSVDSGGAPVVRKFYAELGLKVLAVYVDRSLRMKSALRVLGLPTTVLLDREGREIARHVGAAEWDSPSFVRSIQAQMRPQAK